MGRWILVGFAVAVALVCSQFPAYRQDYLQRLGGALDEVTRQVQALDARAAAADLERYAYVRRLTGNPDPVVAREGEALVDLLARQQRLIRAQAELEAAPIYYQAIQVALHLEPDIAAAAFQDFEPAAPLSLSGGFHAFVGFFLGLLLPQGLRRLFPRRVPVEG
jgi:hypothetical protein